MELAAGIETTRLQRSASAVSARERSEGEEVNTNMASSGSPWLSPAQIRLALIAAMGVFFASAAVIPAMGTLLRQITRLLLP
ncbi:MAG TPA: hypothetical protein VIA62_14415 [Thermoanaerobaculia bacterium]|jgi:hypothetical protein|nr:hypothetical protein [Thermoanaerobaculia bacterium]